MSLGEAATKGQGQQIEHEGASWNLEALRVLLCVALFVCSLFCFLVLCFVYLYIYMGFICI